MKTKRVEKKLVFIKETIADLKLDEIQRVIAGKNDIREVTVAIGTCPPSCGSCPVPC